MFTLYAKFNIAIFEIMKMIENAKIYNLFMKLKCTIFLIIKFIF